MTTAGETASSDHMSRALGIDCSCCSVKFCCTRVVVTSTSGASAVTITASCTVATPISMCTVAVKPSVTPMASRFVVVKPVSSNVSA